MQLRRGFSNTLLTGALALVGAFLLTPAPAQADQSTDDLLGKVFEQIESNHLDKALGQVEALLRAKPNFRLAYLIKGDLLGLARSRTQDFRQRTKGSGGSARRPARGKR